MTIAIISGALVLAGIGLCLWFNCSSNWQEWLAYIGAFMVFLAGVAFVINLFMWIPYKKDSLIMYERLLQEKQVLEQVLETGSELDKIAIRRDVIDYNNRIIEIRIDHKRLIYRGYYRKDIDWAGLELIEWRTFDGSICD